MKKTLSDLLFEDFPPQPDQNFQGIIQIDPASTMQPKNISLDQKVDHYLLQYERDSSPNAPKMSSSSNIPIPSIPESKNVKIKRILFEADEDLAGGLGDLDLGSGGEEKSNTGSEANPVVPVPKLNINVFAERVARLVYNYEALLDPRTIILNRAQAYLSKNYSPNMAKELMALLQTNYGLSPISLQDKTSENPPPSVGSGLGDLSSSTPSGTTVRSGT
jgi:hypothetical protein